MSSTDTPRPLDTARPHRRLATRIVFATLEALLVLLALAGAGYGAYRLIKTAPKAKRKPPSRSARTAGNSPGRAKTELTTDWSGALISSPGTRSMTWRSPEHPAPSWMTAWRDRRRCSGDWSLSPRAKR